MKAIDGNKICSKCKINKPISEYHKNKTQPDGFHNWCKSCLIDFRLSYKSTKIEYDKQYHIDNREKKCDAANNWYYDNYKYSLDKNKQWRDSNKEWVKKYQKESDVFKIAHRKSSKKSKARSKSKGYFSLFENPFPKEIKVDMHHLNDKQGLVIHLPTRLHEMSGGNNHREKCNGWIYYLYGIEIDTLLR